MSIRESTNELVQLAREAASRTAERLPDVARTPAQKVLQQKHGTPRGFARACIATIGEVSVAEAWAAIDKYTKEWEAA